MWNWIKSKLSDATEVARYAIFGCLVVIIIMWLINISGYGVLNGVFGFIGLVLVIFLTLSPKVIQPSAALTGLAALLNRSNPISGALAGPRWIISVAKSFLYGFLFFATFLTFWSFENSPWAFWGIFLVAIMLFIWRERYGNMGNWGKWIEWTYIIVCGVVLLWSTLPDSWNGRSFDPNTGAALHMVDPTTGKVDSLNRTPAECAVRACFSEESNAQLVPMNRDQALSRNVSAWPGLGAEAARNATGLPGWLIVIIVLVVVVVGVVFRKNLLKVLLTVIFLGGVAGICWAVYSYASSATSCPGTFSAGEVIVVRRGCTAELNSPNGTNFRARDGRFDGLLTQYVDIEQPYAGFYKLKPNSGFPEGVDEVEVATTPPN